MPLGRRQVGEQQVRELRRHGADARRWREETSERPLGQRSGKRRDDAEIGPMDHDLERGRDAAAERSARQEVRNRVIERRRSRERSP